MNVVHRTIQEALKTRPIFEEDMELVTDLSVAICGPMGNIDLDADLRDVTLVTDGFGKIWYGDTTVDLVKALSSELGVSVYTE